MVAGKVRSCNASYGFNGWLGLASINITGGVHITQGYSKMNDSYFNGGGYTETNRQHVMCQEIGHTLGLDHQSTSGADLYVLRVRRRTHFGLSKVCQLSQTT